MTFAVLGLSGSHLEAIQRFASRVPARVVVTKAANDLSGVFDENLVVVASDAATGETAHTALKAMSVEFPVIWPSASDRARGTWESWCETKLHDFLMPDVSRRILTGESALMEGLRQKIAQVAQFGSVTVLITGESGTGKELAAEMIHHLSPRRQQPFVKVNCAAIPETLLESELFGHERGAFTGAHALHQGLLEQANGGTLLLDEIGDMDLGAQAKILRAIETKRVQRLGGRRDIEIDVRIVAATNHNLTALVKSGRFREDLYYRLKVIRLELPALRERLEDAAGLFMGRLRELSATGPRRLTTVSSEARRALERYSWPGNVRELRNVADYCYVFATGAAVGWEDLPEEVRSGSGEEERRRVVEALAEAGGNRSVAARTLRVSRMTLYRRMARFGL